VPVRSTSAGVTDSVSKDQSASSVVPSDQADTQPDLDNGTEATAAATAGPATPTAAALSKYIPALRNPMPALSRHIPALSDQAPPLGDPALSSRQVAARMPVPAPGERSPKPPKTAWRAPGLDGVRALAVLAVLAFHEGIPWIPGGFLGVDIFFVLSGYLITDLLVARHRRDGTVGLKSFWQRRARRLLPALALLLVAVTAAVAVLEPDQRAALRPALLGALTYTSNWWQAFAGQSYFTQFGPPPPLAHLWSLAVEEQFYLLWPLVLAVVLTAVRRRWLRAMVAWAGALVSALIMFAVYAPGSDPSLVYYGTDTHASALMVGAALALTWPLAKVAATAGKLRGRLDVVGAAGAVVLAFCMWHFSGANSLVYPYGLALAALAAGGLVLAAAAPGRVGAALSWKPLRWLGIRSYGIYLWHWPVIAITTGVDEHGASSLTARSVETLLPIALAAASWRWIEEPILRNGLRRELRRTGGLFRQAIVTIRHAPLTAVRTPAASLPVAGAVLLLALTGTAGYGILNPPTGPTLQQQIDNAAKLIAGDQLQSLAVPRSSGQAGQWWLRGAAGLGPYRVGAHTARIRPVRSSGSKVIAIGDSVLLAAAPELARAIPGIYINAKVSRQMYTGLDMVRRLAAARRLRPVVILALGTNGTVTLRQINQVRTAIGNSRWLVLVNTFVPRSWERGDNAAMAAASRYPNVLLVNWHNTIEHHTNLLWSDGIHPQPVGGTLYARVVRLVVLLALRHPPRLPRPEPRSIAAPLGHVTYLRLW